MGFFKKVFKGIGKVFRKIGRGIKKVAGKVGKMFGKLGIVGQIGLGLLLPGVGQVLSGMLGSVGGALAGSSSALISGAGKFIQGAIKIGTKVGNAFSTVTEGVTKVIGEATGAIINKIPEAGNLLKNISGGRINITDNNWSSVWETAQTAVKDSVAAGKDIFTTMATGPETAALIQQTGYEAPSYGDLKYEPQDIPDLSQPPMPALEEIQVTAQKLPTSSPSLLDRGITAIKEAPARFGEAAISTVENYPQEIASKIKSGVTTQAMQKLGLEDEPVYNITNVAGYVPTIDLEGTSDIGIASAQFNPVDYMTNNSEAMSLKPFGFNANIYNYANQYKGAMSQYGYAV